MLCRFAVTNYRGGEHKIEWDLTKARDYRFNSFAVKDNSVKNGIIYGQKGSVLPFSAELPQHGAVYICSPLHLT